MLKRNRLLLFVQQLLARSWAYWLLTYVANYLLLIHVVHERLRDWFLSDAHIPYAIPFLEHVLILAVLAVVHVPRRRWYDWFASALVIAPWWAASDFALRTLRVIPTVDLIATHYRSWIDFFPWWLWALMGAYVIFFVWYVGWGWWHEWQKRQWRTWIVRAVALTLILGFVMWEAPRMARGEGWTTFYRSGAVPAFAVSTNGRMVSFVVRSWQYRYDRVRARAVQPHWTPEEILEQIFSGVPAHRRNIYIVLLESFIDPRDFEGVRWLSSPLHPHMRPFLRDERFPIYASSAYVSWGTGQTTFEVLTGLPARAQFSDVEFGAMEGAPFTSLLWRLKQFGYHTYAFVASNDLYYNMRRAYPSIGFDTTIYMSLLPRFYGNERIPDDSLYAFVREHWNGMDSPRLVYMVTMYGHWPWSQNPPLGPDDSVQVEPNHPVLHRLGLWFYYRTRALAHWIRWVYQQDSTALVVAYGDHTPPFTDDLKAPIQYRRSLREVPVLVLDRGHPVQINDSLQPIRFYQLSWVIYYCLRQGQCRHIPDSVVLRPTLPIDSLYVAAMHYGMLGKWAGVPRK